MPTSRAWRRLPHAILLLLFSQGNKVDTFSLPLLLLHADAKTWHIAFFVHDHIFISFQGKTCWVFRLIYVCWVRIGYKVLLELLIFVFVLIQSWCQLTRLDGECARAGMNEYLVRQLTATLNQNKNTSSGLVLTELLARLKMFWVYDRNSFESILDFLTFTRVRPQRHNF